MELVRIAAAGEFAEPNPSTSSLTVAELKATGVQVGHLGDAGELLDSQAKGAYRRRLAELREEQEEARTLGQVGRAEQAEDEIDALVSELARATGLKGRSRVACSSSERARQSVTRAIKGALSKIAGHHPELGNFLRRSIKTGTYCSYNLDPKKTVDWETETGSGDETPSAPQQRLIESDKDQPTGSEQRANAKTRWLRGAQPKFGRRNEAQLLRDLIEQSLGGSVALALVIVGPIRANSLPNSTCEK